MPQKKLRGAPLAVCRKPPYPAAIMAAATVSPATAAMAVPSIVIPIEVATRASSSRVFAIAFCLFIESPAWT
jgi:hypothetical protein